LSEQIIEVFQIVAETTIHLPQTGVTWHLSRFRDGRRCWCWLRQASASRGKFSSPTFNAQPSNSSVVGFSLVKKVEGFIKRGVHIGVFVVEDSSVIGISGCTFSAHIKSTPEGLSYHRRARPSLGERQRLLPAGSSRPDRLLATKRPDRQGSQASCRLWHTRLRIADLALSAPQGRSFF